MSSITFQTLGNQSGKEIKLYRIVDYSGAYIEILNYGATLVSIYVPDSFGYHENVILGYSDLKKYFIDTCYIGSTIGRFANRIAHAQFTLNGRISFLDKNDGDNCNHSGYSGFHQKIFDAKIQNNELILSILSPDGEGGFPGNMIFEVHFSFLNQVLNIKYVAICDRKTVFNPTCHAYFNLSGKKVSILQHELKINSVKYLEMDNCFLPTGRILQVDDTAVDFSQYRSIEQMLSIKHGMIKGYNTCFPIPGNGNLRPMASLRDKSSGRVLTISSTMPGILLYTGDFLCGQFAPFDGLCLEAQFYPDSPNKCFFPFCTIEPEILCERIIQFQFSCVKY